MDGKPTYAGTGGDFFAALCMDMCQTVQKCGGLETSLERCQDECMLRFCDTEKVDTIECLEEFQRGCSMGPVFNCKECGSPLPEPVVVASAPDAADTAPSAAQPAPARRPEVALLPSSILPPESPVRDPARVRVACETAYEAIMVKTCHVRGPSELWVKPCIERFCVGVDRADCIRRARDTCDWDALLSCPACR